MTNKPPYHIAHYLLYLTSALITIHSEANTSLHNLPNTSNMPPLRVAIGVGKGNTDWQYLTSNDDTLALSVPNSAKDRGTAYRIESEFQFTPHVAAGINMQQFADSTIHFPYGNMYHHGTMDAFDLKSATRTYGTFIEFTLPMSSRTFAFSLLGAQTTHRHDQIANKWHAGGLFGGGMGYTITHRLDSTIGFDYTTGFAKTEAMPAHDYVPFTYTFYTTLGLHL